MSHNELPAWSGLCLRALSRKKAMWRPTTRRQRKQLGAESLEPRQLLAGDVVISEVMYHPIRTTRRTNGSSCTIEGTPRKTWPVIDSVRA